MQTIITERLELRKRTSSRRRGNERAKRKEDKKEKEYFKEREFRYRVRVLGLEMTLVQCSSLRIRTYTNPSKCLKQLHTKHELSSVRQKV